MGPKSSDADTRSQVQSKPSARRLKVDISVVSRAPLRTLLAEDFRVHYRSLVHPGLHALFVYRIGHWALSQRPAVRIPVKILHRLINRLIIQNLYGTEIADDANIGRRVLIGHHLGVQIPSSGIVGDDCVIRHNVTLGLTGTVSNREDVPRIGRRVELGANCTVLGPVSIGDGAKIGPHAIVMVDMPAGATAFSQPARILISPQESDGKT